MSVFTTQFTVPRTRPATDHEMHALYGYSYGPIQDFGIGEPCLFELVHGDCIFISDRSIVVFFLNSHLNNYPYLVYSIEFKGITCEEAALSHAMLPSKY